jgi:hypothetical protein
MYIYIVLGSKLSIFIQLLSLVMSKISVSKGLNVVNIA